MAEIQIAHLLSRGDVYYDHVAPVRARFAYARVAIDRYERKLPVGGRGDFVAGDAFFWNSCDLPAGIGVNNAKSVIAFISYEQDALLWRACSASAGEVRHQVNRDNRNDK